jgi:WD40 repeat protein
VWDEESGELHRELEIEGFGGSAVSNMVCFVSPDGQQPRLVQASYRDKVRVYDPEAGSLLHHLDSHDGMITALACIASSSAAPHHPRLVSASEDYAAKVWDGETGEMLAELGAHLGGVNSVAVWKEHTGGHDRIATCAVSGATSCQGVGRRGLHAPPRLRVRQPPPAGLQVGGGATPPAGGARL